MLPSCRRPFARANSLRENGDLSETDDLRQARQEDTEGTEGTGREQHRGMGARSSVWFWTDRNGSFSLRNRSAVYPPECATLRFQRISGFREMIAL